MSAGLAARVRSIMRRAPTDLAPVQRRPQKPPRRARARMAIRRSWARRPHPVRWAAAGLRRARTALLTIAGFACIVVGAALWHPIAGWLTAGASLILVEALSSADNPKRSNS